MLLLVLSSYIKKYRLVKQGVVNSSCSWFQENVCSIVTNIHSTLLTQKYIKLQSNNKNISKKII